MILQVLRLQLSLSEKTTSPGRFVMTDSFLGNNSDEEVDAEIKDSENLDRTLSDIIEGKSHSSSRNSVRDTEESVSSAGGSFQSTPKTSSTEESSSDNSHRQKEADSMFVHRGVADSRVSSHSEAGGDVNATASTELSHETSDLSYLPTNSGESNVIADCDPTQRRGTGDSEVKGKTFRPPGSQQPITNINPLSGKSTCTRRTPENPGLRKTTSERQNSQERMYKTSISDPDQHFPDSWELYEEVVEVSSDKEARVITRISTERDTVKVPSLNRNPEESSGAGNNKSLESSAVGSYHTLPADTLKAKARSWINGNVYSGGEPKNIRGSLENNAVSEQETRHSKMDQIPDVVIIYEPSCGPRSLTCGCEDSDEQDFVLKESTV